MYGSLRGTISARLGQRVLLEVNNVGYWIFTGSWLPDGEVLCYLHHHVREDMSDLYGFMDLATLELFELLLGVSGVGPKAALALLSLGTPLRIKQAIQSSDAGFLSQAPGIGNKAAQKIIVDLQSKIGFVLPEMDSSQLHLYSDLLATLEGLGYKEGQIRPFLDQIPADHQTLDQQLRWLLQNISK